MLKITNDILSYDIGNTYFNDYSVAGLTRRPSYGGSVDEIFSVRTERVIHNNELLNLKICQIDDNLDNLYFKVRRAFVFLECTTF